MIKKKAYFFYEEDGTVYMIYTIEPPKDLLEDYVCIEGYLEEDKKGFYTNYKLDMDTKELKHEYNPIEPKN